MITEKVIPHFAHPRGPYGWIAGRIMASRASNIDRNSWLVDHLDIHPDSTILELGHGPGLAIARIWPQLDDGHITGVDISRLMTRTASRRNRDGVAAGRVTCTNADATQLPDSLRGFDLIFGVNVAMFWPDQTATIGDLASRLGPGGELVIAYMPPPTADEQAVEVAQPLAAAFYEAGLTDIRCDTMEYDPPAMAVRGLAP